MNPMPPPNEGPSTMPSSGPFMLDKAYVGLDALLFIGQTLWSMSLIPARTDEAMKQMANSPNAGKGPSAETMQTIMMATTGGCTCIFLILYIFLWFNMIKGKKWAFIVNLVFICLGLAMSLMGMAGAGMPLAIFGIVTSLAKGIYNFLRVSGKLGPALS